MSKPVFVFVAAVVATAAMSVPWSGTLKGFSLDSLVWLRQSVFGPQYDRSTSPTVVIAIDEETYRREPFRNTPKVMWTNELTAVVDSVADGGAAVIGFDLILPTSVASRFKGFDRPFLRSLREHASEGRLVLSKVQHSTEPILPSVGQRIAVGHNQNIRATNFYSDTDGIVRGVPIAFRLTRQGGDTDFEPSLATELARRALGNRLSFDTEGHLSRDGVPVPTIGNNNLLVNFDDNQSGIPTFSLADLHACAAAGETDFFRRHFSNKIVILGAVLDVEDRELSSLRYATASDSAAFVEHCDRKRTPALLGNAIVRDSVPGVYVHAFAVNNLVRGNFLVRPSPPIAAAIVFAFALAAGVATSRYTAVTGSVIIAMGAVAWTGLTVSLSERGFAAPLYEPPLAASIVFAVLSAYRFTIANRDERRIREMFGLYLAPAVIEQLIESGEMPTLGGETRELTIYFSDLEGFTSLSEVMNADELVLVLNEYLTAMGEIIESHGGFVDKYIGDAVVAVFGAPHHDPDHAVHAVEAALECQWKLGDLNTHWSNARSIRLSQRIGINSGSVVVGNIGSRRRFNYTVIGDDVNVAARLESANKLYGTGILVSDATMIRCLGKVACREIDQVRVAGRSEPVGLFAPLKCGEEHHTFSEYSNAFSLYQAGEFAVAADVWARLADIDPPSATMFKRSKEWAVSPPVDWDGVYSLEIK